MWCISYLHRAHYTRCSISSDPAPNQGSASHLRSENWATCISPQLHIRIFQRFSNGFLHSAQSDLNWKCWRGWLVGRQLSRFKLAVRPRRASQWSKPRKVSGLRIWNVNTKHKDFFLFSSNNISPMPKTFLKNLWGLSKILRIYLHDSLPKQ